MRKRALLILATALLVAAAGVVYAHWTETLNVNATVSTGDIDTYWTDLFTDDDGVLNTGFDNEPGSPILYVHGAATGADPSEVGPMADRYDKDVADCIASGEGTEMFTLIANNVYPSYNCTMWSTFINDGTVPVKVQSIVTTTIKGTTRNYNLAGEGTWETLDGTLCGLQIDPGETNTTINWFHIEQGASEEATYAVEQTITFVNWNEWDPALCTHTFNGVVYPLALEQ